MNAAGTTKTVDAPCVREVLAAAARRLAETGVADGRRDARLLLAEALGCPVSRLLACPEQPVDGAAVAAFEAMLADRALRKPVSRILGRREFWSLPFAIDESTLDPRPDSETLVEAVLAALPDHHAALRILDLGTGSGCLLLALLSACPNAWGLGVDSSPGAARMARRNARALALDRRAGFVVSDWAAPLAGRFDVVIANPPYVGQAEMAALAPEVVRHDPAAALLAGRDGLDAYRDLAPALPRLLSDGGVAALEIGVGQAEQVERLLTAAGLAKPAVAHDLGGVPRCLLATTGTQRAAWTKKRLETSRVADTVSVSGPCGAPGVRGADAT